jgi:hypothetical protein
MNGLWVSPKPQTPFGLERCSIGRNHILVLGSACLRGGVHEKLRVGVRKLYSELNNKYKLAGKLIFKITRMNVYLKIEYFHIGILNMDLD